MLTNPAEHGKMCIRDSLLGPCMFAVMMGIGRTGYGIFGHKLKKICIRDREWDVSGTAEFYHSQVHKGTDTAGNRLAEGDRCRRGFN